MMVMFPLFFLLVAVTVSAFQSPLIVLQRKISLSPTTSLHMVKNRGLEQKREGATPQEGGMTLYVKAASDGTSVGDCPFAQFVRMVLEEKGLEYDLRPSTAETKPSWLVEHYEGKLPALRHRKECYVESDVIGQYLDFFFPEPSLSPSSSRRNAKQRTAAAADAVDGFFPAVARYLKHTPDGDEEDLELKAKLEDALQRVEDVLLEGEFLCHDEFTLLDCGLAPKLYHMRTGVKEFKSGAIDFEQQFPKVNKYMETVFARESFVKTQYPEDVIVWGWSNARN